MSEVITGLFDSRFNGIDLLWLVIALVFIALAEHAVGRYRWSVERARQDLEAAARAQAAVEDFGFDYIFVGDDPWGRGVLVAEIKVPDIPTDEASRQAAAYRYLAGSRGRHLLLDGR